MPRYFIDTFNGFVARDEEGQEMPDLEAVRTLVRKSLAAMMKDEKDGRPAFQLRADVRDEAGNRVMTGTIVLVIDETGAGAPECFSASQPR